MTDDQAATIGQELEVDGEFQVDDQGVLQYIDPEAYMPIPARDVEPRETEDEDETEQYDPSMAMDFQALSQQPEPPNPDELGERLLQALEAAEALPDDPLQFERTASNASIEVASADDGSREFERRLDTAFYLTPSFDGIRLEGPGAKIRSRASNSGEGTVIGDVRHSFRQVEPGPEIELTPPEEVVERYGRAVNQLVDGEIVELAEPRLTYLAPELRRVNDNPVGEGTNEVQALVPHYSVGGTVRIKNDEAEEPVEVELLREYVPATTDDEFVPVVEVSANAEGDRVDASVDVEGGQPPYKVEWNLSQGSLGLDPATTGDPPEISETITAREAIEETTITAEVTDANGVTVSAQQRLTVAVEPELSVAAGASGRLFGSRPHATRTGSISGPADASARTDTNVPGTVDVGTETAIWPNWASGFIREARIAGVSRNNTWTGNSVWEKDFRSPTDDNVGVDTADLVFASGHGMPRGWTVENPNHDDKWIWHTNADGDWGDFDIEWLALMSCNVLAPDDGSCGSCNGLSVFDRWRQEFDGLHQFQGFRTLGWRVPGFPDAYGRYVFGNWFFPGLPLRKAWFLAVDNYQPAYDTDQNWRVRGAVMYTADSEGRSCFNDHFHGEGPVGPDIPLGQSRWICYVIGGVGGG
ncbi:hypothetical protein G9464_10420 [Halostella sp. JP-L12]|uniref:DUF6345 domain-containing protein n=1 Tax=Halostella sp. JP-L12 TaxID=2716716 RepID=UPI000EF82AE5|nr:DUF6345 domain-containing protein [Halostella sp. JP-L12]NHN48010.1 hypothetical protein [Halostella sp. JP-L12]